MADKKGDIFPIKSKEITEAQKTILPYMKSVSWTPNKVSKDKELPGGMAQLISIVNTGKTNVQQLEVIDEIKKLSDNEELMSDHSNKVANTILYGLSLGWATAKQYAKTSGLENLRAVNRQQEEISSSHQGELQQKLQTESAVFLFTSSYYIVHSLSKYKTEEMDKRVIPQISIPEFVFIKKEKAIQCTLFYYGSCISSREMTSDDVALVRVTLEYFKSVLSEISMCKSSLQYTESFDGKNYEVENSDFVFRGFDSSLKDEIKNIAVNEVRFDEIVGNREVKLETHRLVHRLMTYCVKEKRNPMVDLRGLVRISMGMGIPGTGKTLLISAAATMIRELCQDLGVRFLYHPLSPDIVSKFQGETSERMMEWFRPQTDPETIVFAPIDDAESVFAKRGEKESSEGSNNIIKVFLTQTEGASSVYRGQNIIPFYTNNWEIMDPAVISRIQKRTFILGAQTPHDFMDQAYLWYNVLNKQSEQFVKFEKPTGYTFLDDQKMLTSFSSFNKEQDTVPKNEELKSIYHSVIKKYNPEKNPEFFGEFSYGIMKAFPNIWAPRDERNVYSAVSDKLMDFDYPNEWWNDPGKFFAKTYDEKYKKLLELRDAAMKGLSFSRIWLQELVKYADIAVAISNTAYEKSVQSKMQELKVYEEARQRMTKLAS